MPAVINDQSNTILKAECNEQSFTTRFSCFAIRLISLLIWQSTQSQQLTRPPPDSSETTAHPPPPQNGNTTTDNETDTYPAPAHYDNTLRHNTVGSSYTRHHPSFFSSILLRHLLSSSARCFNRRKSSRSRWICSEDFIVASAPSPPHRSTCSTPSSNTLCLPQWCPVVSRSWSASV